MFLYLKEVKIMQFSLVLERYTKKAINTYKKFNLDCFLDFFPKFSLTLHFYFLLVSLYIFPVDFDFNLKVASSLNLPFLFAPLARFFDSLLK